MPFSELHISTLYSSSLSAILSHVFAASASSGISATRGHKMWSIKYIFTLGFYSDLIDAF